MMQGKPMPQAPAGGAPAPQGGGLKEVIADVSSKLSQLSSFMDSQDPQAGQAMAQVLSQFQQIVQGLAAPKAPPQAAPGAASPEAGANPNARPV